MLHEAFWEHFFYARHLFLNGIHISRLVEYQLKITNIQDNQAPAKRERMFENNREITHKDCRRTIRELTDTIGISLEFARS
jgi:hypothetical protein